MNKHIRGAGAGLRREFAQELVERADEVDFIEITPENFIGRGGQFHAALEAMADRGKPILAHGVSFNLAGQDPFDDDQVRGLKALLDRFGIETFSDHLCFCTGDGFVSYDLIPVPYTDATARFVASRIRELSSRLERPVYVENISAYIRPPGTAMSEGDFTTAVCDYADCGMLLDVNNVYVNAHNHNLDASALLRSLPVDRALQVHIAGHTDKAVLKIDTHGAPVCDDVWSLLEQALPLTGPVPIILERDTDIPPLDEVLAEVRRAREIYDRVFAGDDRAQGNAA